MRLREILAINRPPRRMVLNTAEGELEVFIRVLTVRDIMALEGLDREEQPGKILELCLADEHGNPILAEGEALSIPVALATELLKAVAEVNQLPPTISH